MNKEISIIGQKNNMLTALSYADDIFYSNGKKQKMVKCLCECGNETTVRIGAFKCGSTKSCGCIALSHAREANRTHGLSNHRLYVIWNGMKNRCNKEDADGYDNYGGRGICYDERWQKFENFYGDMIVSYQKHIEKFGEKNTTLDRYPDKDGNYSEDNCRWSTLIEQHNNKRNNNYIQYKGKIITLTALGRICGLSATTLRRRKNKGFSVKGMMYNGRLTKKKYQTLSYYENAEGTRE